MTLIVDPARLSIVGNVTTVHLATPAWYLAGTHQLRGTGAVRGSDRVMPAVNGVRTYPRRSTLTEYNLSLWLNGEFDHDGNRVANACSNVVALFDNLVAELINTSFTGEITAVRDCTLHHPSGGTNRTGKIRVVEITPRDTHIGVPLWRCDFVVQLPFGRLA